MPYLTLLQIHLESANVHPSHFYTTENLISVLIGIITVASSLVIWFVKSAIERAETREEKIDQILAEMKREITDLQKDSSIHTYSYSTIDRRLEKLESWKEQTQQQNQKGK
jgi:F0F1-type ATP synthase epsilon subunit